MKPKSRRLRMLVTLHALFKYSDEKHPLNNIALQQYLKPYHLDCTESQAYRDTLNALEEYGVHLKHKKDFKSLGAWIEERPLSNDTLNALIFSVTTNPYVSKKDADKILKGLTSLVTVYQEPLLKSFVQKEYDQEIKLKHFNTKMDICEIYRVIHEAIATNQRVRYQSKYMKYDEETSSIIENIGSETIFLPKYIRQGQGKLYMVGYNNTQMRMDNVDISNIHDIDFVHIMNKKHNAEEVKKMLAEMKPEEDIKTKENKLIYSGKAVFKCRGQYRETLYKMFGSPDSPIEKDRRCLCIYSVEHAKIDSKTLAVLSDIPDYGIHIIGPEALTTAVKKYYDSTAFNLLNPEIPRKNS